MMLKLFSWALLGGLILTGEIRAQEVIVASEKKPEHTAQTPQPSEQSASELPTPAPHKIKSHEKKSVPARLTLEEMREAGARAAEGLNNRSGSPSMKAREPDVDSAPIANPTVAETPRLVKKQTPVEQRSSSRPAKSHGTNIEGMGPIRPTLMESGREASSPTPSVR